jgi:cephalosporin hydroxylase
MMDPIQQFKEDLDQRVASYADDKELKSIASEWVQESMKKMYVYNFSWLGRPIIQYPQDIVAIQEIIWKVKPDLIIETGIAHGGSIILSASILELLGGDRHVIGIDIDIRKHNRDEIEQHPLSRRIKMIEGSSIDEGTAKQVYKMAEGKSRILVILDSNHTHAHVKKEIELYHSLVSVGSYLMVFDTIVEDLPKDYFEDRPWNVGDNPKTAVHEFLRSNTDFEIDKSVQNKLIITAAPDGYLRRIK